MRKNHFRKKPTDGGCLAVEPPPAKKFFRTTRNRTNNNNNIVLFGEEEMFPKELEPLDGGGGCDEDALTQQQEDSVNLPAKEKDKEEKEEEEYEMPAWMQQKTTFTLRQYGRRKQNVATTEVISGLSASASTVLSTTSNTTTSGDRISSVVPTSILANPTEKERNTLHAKHDHYTEPYKQPQPQKKKGSIFKCRPVAGASASSGSSSTSTSNSSNTAPGEKRYVYKHKWHDGNEKVNASAIPDAVTKPPVRSIIEYEEEEGTVEGDDVKLPVPLAHHPATVSDVKQAHQMQEIGELQELDDDVEYLLSALQPGNPSSTRCLSALQLATKCTRPGFKLHVRAHGIAARFFRALADAHRDPVLGLCTAAIMYVLSQDTLHIDIDRDSLQLMLQLLDAEAGGATPEDVQQQLRKATQRVRELCEQIKMAGKAKHIDLDRISVGTLAMESLLSLAPKAGSGEWIKDELRMLGGIERLIKTISACCVHILKTEGTVLGSETVAKLRKIERCMRVLENVTFLSEKNQSYILQHADGASVQTLVSLYGWIGRKLVLHHADTECSSEAASGMVLVRELLSPVLKMLITLTHSFQATAHGAKIVGEISECIDVSAQLLLEPLDEGVPESLSFELHLLVLMLLINLTINTEANRTKLMDTTINSGTAKDTRMSLIQALVDYFYRQHELAICAEQGTDAILDAKPKKDTDITDTVSKLLQKAGRHMEHTMLASYVCLVLGYLVVGSTRNEAIVRGHLRENDFAVVIASLNKYYNFLNLTTHSDAVSLAHVHQTKQIINQLVLLDSEGESGQQQ